MSTILLLLLAIPFGAAVGYYGAKVMSHLSRGWAWVIGAVIILAPFLWGTDVRTWLVNLAWSYGAYFGAVLLIWIALRVTAWVHRIPLDPPYADTSRLDHMDGVS